MGWRNYNPLVHDEASVKGDDALVGKHSAVDATGELQVKLIDGVRFRAARPVLHEDGTLTEIAREAWAEIDLPIVQAHVTSTLPGRIRAWGLHKRSTDRLFVVSGMISIVVYDARRGSETFDATNQFLVGDRSPGLLIIPPNLYHGWRNIGTTEAFIVNLPSVQYNYDEPDAQDLPYESEQASEIVPFRW
jgi:dTDP-4-dehydrorhamnose 3,5-epimerase